MGLHACNESRMRSVSALFVCLWDLMPCEVVCAGSQGHTGRWCATRWHSVEERELGDLRTLLHGAHDLVMGRWRRPVPTATVDHPRWLHPQRIRLQVYSIPGTYMSWNPICFCILLLLLRMTHQRSVQLTTLHYQNAELEAQAIFRSESSLPTKKSLLHRSVSRSERRVYFELEVHYYTCFVCGFASFLLINVVELEKSSKWGIGFRVYGIARKKPKEEERTRRVCVWVFVTDHHVLWGGCCRQGTDYAWEKSQRFCKCASQLHCCVASSASTCSDQAIQWHTGWWQSLPLTMGFPSLLSFVLLSNNSSSTSSNNNNHAITASLPAPEPLECPTTLNNNNNNEIHHQNAHYLRFKDSWWASSTTTVPSSSIICEL